MIFNEGVFPCKETRTKSDPTSSSEDPFTHPEVTPIKVELPAQTQTSQETEAVTEHGGETGQTDPECEDEIETADDTKIQPEHLQDYQLARDRTRRQVRAPMRYSYADLIYTALLAGTEVQRTEPETYEEAM